MTIQDIIRKYLIENGYTGLCHIDTECGCGLDELYCTEYCPNKECEPAYAVTCLRCGETVYSKVNENLNGCCCCGGDNDE